MDTKTNKGKQMKEYTVTLTGADALRYMKAEAQIAEIKTAPAQVEITGPTIEVAKRKSKAPKAEINAMFPGLQGPRRKLTKTKFTELVPTLVKTATTKCREAASLEQHCSTEGYSINALARHIKVNLPEVTVVQGCDVRDDDIWNKRPDATRLYVRLAEHYGK